MLSSQDDYVRVTNAAQAKRKEIFYLKNLA